MSYLKVIGAGLGRTGTLSLKAALNQLGVGPCYHMGEVRGNPGHIEHWLRVAAGDHTRERFAAIFENYNATVDWPAGSYYKPIFEQNPDAKVILSIRPTDKWWASMDKTIMNVVRHPVNDALPPDGQAQMAMAKFMLGERIFKGKIDEASVKAHYDRHNQEVRDTIPKGQLLEFDPTMGWEPLCKFLGVPVPAEPYPDTNKTKDFRESAKIVAD